MTDVAPQPPVIPGPDGAGVSDLRAHFARAIATAAPPYLPRQRWFGDKTRSIAAVELADAAIDEVGGDPLALAMVAVSFAGGGAVAYFVPLVLTGRGVPPAAILATTNETPRPRHVADALAVPAVRSWLLDRLTAAGDDRSDAGTFTWRTSADLPAFLASAREGTSRLSSAEQSNSAIVYGGSLLLKVFRKLQPGLNPDIEIGRFLTERTTFRHLPPLLGDVTYRPREPGAPEISLAMAQPFVASQGDGWSVMLDRLATHLAGEAVDAAIGLARRLGERTAQLHLALASDPSDPAFAPEPITEDDVQGWSDDLAAALDRTIADLHARAERLPVHLRDRVSSLSPDDPDLDRRRRGFRALVGVARTRVHGDYHLGQTLVTPDDDVVIIDFEGEPARPLAERRQKTSPLKDVAGMLRSFGYARAAALRANGASRAHAETDSDLLAWEQAARAALLDAYLTEARAGKAPFLPAAGDAFAAAIAAWELDKAVYEVNYELNNRPDWLELPLSTMLAQA